jgi:hypothetical protein
MNRLQKFVDAWFRGRIFAENGIYVLTSVGDADFDALQNSSRDEQRTVWTLFFCGGRPRNHPPEKVRSIFGRQPLPLAAGTVAFLAVGEPAVYRLSSGIPTQVVVPSVSRAAVLHGLAGTIIVAVPSLAGWANPVVELAGCSATP